MKTALDIFTDYFVENYPGPNTRITDPRWHAPKIFRAAQDAIAQSAPGAIEPDADHLALQITTIPAPDPSGALETELGERIAEALAADGLGVDDTHERGPAEYYEALGRIAMASIERRTKGGPAPNSEAVDADPMAYRCPSCGAVKPPMGVSYTQAEVPGMGELIYTTIFCGKCRVILTTQILEMQSAALAAAKSGFAPPNPSRLWTPGGQGN